MKKIFDNGGSAFPTAYTDHNGTGRIEGGMTLRDYFAGQALAGMGMWAPNKYQVWDADGASMINDRAAWAYRQADSMLAARKEQTDD